MQASRSWGSYYLGGQGLKDQQHTHLKTERQKMSTPVSKPKRDLRHVQEVLPVKQRFSGHCSGLALGAPASVTAHHAVPSVAASEAHGAERTRAGVQSGLEAPGRTRGVGGGNCHQPHAARDDAHGLCPLRSPSASCEPPGRRPRASIRRPLLWGGL